LIRFPWGDTQLTVLSAGTLWLDGGAMFGIVPKPLWQRLRQPDEQNRICLAMNLLLIEDGRERILVDTGAGTKWDAKSLEIYRIDVRTPEQILEPVGLRPEQIDRVVVSHLHFDHAGGNTVRDDDGRLRPSFPNARYVIQRVELETARQDNERVRASFFPENFEPLVSSDQVELVQGDVRLTSQVSLRAAPGHTPGMQIVLVHAGKNTVAHMADLLPTDSHVRYPYIMAYDLEPMTTLATKKRILPEAARDDWRLILEHDAESPIVRLVEDRGRLSAQRVELEH